MCRLVFLIVACALLVSAAPGRADQWSTSDLPHFVILWVDDHSGGECVKLNRTVYGLKDMDFNDKASSCWVPQGWTAYFYQHTNFEGRVLEVVGPAYIADLKRDRPNGQNWGDCISSVRILKNDGR